VGNDSVHAVQKNENALSPIISLFVQLKSQLQTIAEMDEKARQAGGVNRFVV